MAKVVEPMIEVVVLMVVNQSGLLLLRVSANNEGSADGDGGGIELKIHMKTSVIFFFGGMHSRHK